MMVHDHELSIDQYLFHTSPRVQVFGLSAINTPTYVTPNFYFRAHHQTNVLHSLSGQSVKETTNLQPVLTLRIYGVIPPLLNTSP
jgi:hypothetical protein